MIMLYSNYLTLVESAILSRHLLGEELTEMGVNELEQLEHQVDASLRQIRSTKVYEIDNFLFDYLVPRTFRRVPNLGFVFHDQARCMLDQLSELKTKVHTL